MSDASDFDFVGESPIRLVGPFEHHDVVVEGREVPYLRATPLDRGMLDLTLDRRFGLVVTAEEAERFIPFLAHAIAVASGYTSHPTVGDDPNPRHPFPRVSPLFAEGP